MRGPCRGGHFQPRQIGGPATQLPPTNPAAPHLISKQGAPRAADGDRRAGQVPQRLDRLVMTPYSLYTLQRQVRLSADITIGKLSRQTGCNIETIRYYERIGLLPRARRAGRYRRYDPDDVARLRFVRRARQLMDRVLSGMICECKTGQQPGCPIIEALSR
jgi:hypothetical protein